MMGGSLLHDCMRDPSSYGSMCKGTLTGFCRVQTLELHCEGRAVLGLIGTGGCYSAHLRQFPSAAQSNSRQLVPFAAIVAARPGNVGAPKRDAPWLLRQYSYANTVLSACEFAMDRPSWMQADQWSQQARAQPGAVADAKLLAEMQAMGFAGSGAAQALVQTGNTGVQQAVNWLFENPQGAADGQPVQPQQAPPQAESRPETPVVFSAQDAGIGGILRRQQEEAQAADSTLKVAFADLKNLEESAKEVVALAERFRSTLSRRDDGSIDGADGEAQAAMQEELLSMGIADPVTKDTAGKKYHQQLARQLDEFLVKPLERAGGMMTMQEVFCLFNRARGTELITPHDLTEAVSRLQKVGSPLVVKAFDKSGVKVICSASLDNEKVLEGLLKLVRPQEGLGGLGIGITERDAAKALNLSLMVAREHILAAENQGMLCRDDSPEGLRFFRNFFPEMAV